MKQGFLLGSGLEKRKKPPKQEWTLKKGFLLGPEHANKPQNPDESSYKELDFTVKSSITFDGK
jgi:hypothetical protein